MHPNRSSPSQVSEGVPPATDTQTRQFPEGGIPPGGAMVSRRSEKPQRGPTPSSGGGSFHGAQRWHQRLREGQTFPNRLDGIPDRPSISC